MPQKPEESEEPEESEKQVEEFADKNVQEEVQEEPQLKNEVEDSPLISTEDNGDLLVCFLFVSFFRLSSFKVLVCYFIQCMVQNLLVQGLNELNPKAAELEETNALALAIVPPGELHCEL